MYSFDAQYRIYRYMIYARVSYLFLKLLILLFMIALKGVYRDNRGSHSPTFGILCSLCQSV